ncbi:MAG: choice-of-anchor V domain-containing protein [Bacteroidia bacterium]
MKSKRYALFTGFGILALSTVLLSNGNGPQSAVSGSPLEGGNDCTQCHSGTVNTGPGTLEITGVESYDRGETYTITVNMDHAGRSKFGFQAIALDDMDQPAGTFMAGDETEIFNSDGNSYIQHKNPNNSGEFTFEWTAPTSGAGGVTFYAAANAANNNNNTKGDYIYTASLVVPAKTVSISKTKFEDVASVIVNESNHLLITSNNGKAIEKLSVIDLSGKVLYNSANVAQASVALNKGVYVVQAYLNNKVYTQKVSL